MGRRFWPTAALVIALFGADAAARAQAQDFPVRPVHVIVPFAPGGGVDMVARLIAPKLSEAWGQPVVIENKPGAVGAVASEYGSAWSRADPSTVPGAVGRRRSAP